MALWSLPLLLPRHLRHPKDDEDSDDDDDDEDEDGDASSPSDDKMST